MLDGRVKQCRYLIKHNDGTTSCKNYRSRLGRIIDVDKRRRVVVCTERKRSPFNYPGCPYNRGEWGMHPLYKNEDTKKDV